MLLKVKNPFGAKSFLQKFFLAVKGNKNHLI